MHAVNDGPPPSGSIPVRLALLLALLAVAAIVLELLDLSGAIDVLLTPLWGLLAIAAALPALTLGIVGTIRHSLLGEGLGYRQVRADSRRGRVAQAGASVGLVVAGLACTLLIADAVKLIVQA
jgi:hypothetical protein